MKEKTGLNSFGNKRWLAQAEKVFDKVESYKEAFRALSDEELRAKTDEFKDRLGKGEKLDNILPEAFAAVREASVRVTGMEHYKVQIFGGLALHQGHIAEMKTGEGKTLVSTLPAYLNALTGKGVHVVTVNDYLAARDAELMGKIHEFLGLTVGVVLSGSNVSEKKWAYGCDITYVTNTELGFDYLRDNMAPDIEHTVLRGLEYAIIDEVDSILIDEARTPLIISGGGTDVSKIYIACDVLAKKMEKGEADKEFNKMDALVGDHVVETGDFIVHEKDKYITLTAQGVKKIEEFFNIERYGDASNILIQHTMELALRANYLMFKDKDYIVRDGQVMIVDMFTGRVMEGRQYADGLHQAIEAKEGVKIQQETHTIATTTYQNFFNKFKKVGGMTGTAFTEKKEFRHTYHLQVKVIPTNKPMIRVDKPDVIYLTKAAKYKGVIAEIKEAHAKDQPVLVGAATVGTSEEISKLLKKEGIKHQVLNAKQDKNEAEIVAQAGKHGTVTIATNMAGRGTDIILDEESKAAGGLKIIGTERHDARRIDNQLRGRAGRQGDPGESVFFLSMEDDMVRLFSPDKVQALLRAGGLEEEEACDIPIFVNAVQKAQQKVEENHFAMRKSVLDYDKVNDRQRELIYKERRKLLAGESASGNFETAVDRFVDGLVENYPYSKEKEWTELAEAFMHTVYSNLVFREGDEKYDIVLKGNEKAVTKVLKEKAKEFLADKRAELAKHNVGEEFERSVLLFAIDAAWMEQLRALDFLRQDVNFMGFAQKDPKSVYAMEAFELYDDMKQNIYRTAVHRYFHTNYEPKVKVIVNPVKRV